MTESMPIPKRKGKQRLVTNAADVDSSTVGDSSPISYDTPSTASTTPTSTTSPDDSRLTAKEKGKAPMKDVTTPQTPKYGHERRTSWLSSSISKSEHMTLNIGDEDRPRLITCVKASQGFDWNQDIFLPSYMSDRDHQSELERRQDPVEDIFITDEEAESMFPS